MRGGALALSGVRSPRQLVLQTIAASPGVASGAAALMAVQQVAEFTVPVLLGVAIDRGIATGDLRGTVFWACLLVADFLVLVVAQQFGSRLGLRAVESVQHKLRRALVERLLSPTGLNQPRSVGELLAITGSDVTRLSHAVLIVVYPVAEVTALAYAAIALGLIWWPLGCAVLLGGLALVLAMEFIGRPFLRRTAVEQEAIAGVSAVAADTLAGVDTLRGFGARAWAVGIHSTANERALVATKRARAAEQRFVGVSRALSAVFVVGVAVTAAFLALAGTISVGQLVIVVGLVQLVIGPLEAIAINLAAVWLAALASATRVLALSAEQPARPEPRATGAELCTSELEPEGEPPALALRWSTDERSDSSRAMLSFEVQAGEVVGVVTDSARAHELVAGLRRCGVEDAGKVMLGGCDASRLDSDALSAHLLVAPKHTAGAALLQPGKSEQRAAHSVRTPHSGGELQRAALAHAYSSSAPVLVLHEPTSALDPVTEQSIAAKLRAAVAGRAVLVVTTAPALLAVTDRVHHLWGGAARSGRHHELLENSDYRQALR